MMVTMGFIQHIFKRSLKGELSFKKLTAFVFLAFIAFVFIFWGISKPISMGIDSGQIAVVNGRGISLWEFQREYQFLENQLGSSLRQNLGASQTRQLLTQQVVERLIHRILAAQYVQSHWNLAVNDRDVVDFIRNRFDIFKEDGHFSKSKYENLLLANQISPRDFENQVREDLRWQRFTTLAQGFLSVSRPETEFYQKIKAVQKRFYWLSLKELRSIHNWNDETFNSILEELKKWHSQAQIQELQVFWQKHEKWRKLTEWLDVFQSTAISHPVLIETSQVWNLSPEKPFPSRLFEGQDAEFVIVKLADQREENSPLPLNWVWNKQWQKNQIWLENQIEAFRSRSQIQTNLDKLLN